LSTPVSFAKGAAAFFDAPLWEAALLPLPRKASVNHGASASSSIGPVPERLPWLPCILE
jgi:hypothetical protein